MTHWRERYLTLESEADDEKNRHFARHMLRLLEEAEQTDVASARFAEIIEDVYNAVLTCTEAYDSWQCDLEDALTDLYDVHGTVFTEEQAEEVALFVYTFCHSWDEPDEVSRGIFLDGFIQKVRRFASPTATLTSGTSGPSDFAQGTVPQNQDEWLQFVDHMLIDRPAELGDLRLGSYYWNPKGFSAALLGNLQPTKKRPWRGALRLEAATGTLTVQVFTPNDTRNPATSADLEPPTVAATWQRHGTDPFQFIAPENTATPPLPVPTPLPMSLLPIQGYKAKVSLQIDCSGFALGDQPPHVLTTEPKFGIVLLENAESFTLPIYSARGLPLSPEAYLPHIAHANQQFEITLGQLEKTDYRVIFRVENLYHPDWGHGAWLTEPCDFLVRWQEVQPWPKGRRRKFLWWPWGLPKRDLDRRLLLD